jgi:hypothetical protein
MQVGMLRTSSSVSGGTPAGEESSGTLDSSTGAGSETSGNGRYGVSNVSALDVSPSSQNPRLSSMFLDSVVWLTHGLHILVHLHVQLGRPLNCMSVAVHPSAWLAAVGGVQVLKVINIGPSGVAEKKNLRFSTKVINQVRNGCYRRSSTMGTGVLLTPPPLMPC